MAAVRQRTPAARAGLRSGDRIVAINGERSATSSTSTSTAAHDLLRAVVEREGRTRSAVLRRTGPDLGLELEAPRPGEIDTCGNKCVFCFIHQLPRGMRKSLYVKDDDFRLSFLHGNYITLTDLDEDELAAHRGAAALAALHLRPRDRSAISATASWASLAFAARSCPSWSAWPRRAS